jgi:head-tail adaptor
MQLGDMTQFIDICSRETVKDVEGFGTTSDTLIASVRAYKEDKNGNRMWANLAAFSTASSLFRFRKIPSVDITTDNVIKWNGKEFKILSVTDIKNRGMYIEALTENVEASEAS